VTCIFILYQRETHSNKTKQYIFGCIAFGWLCIFMLLHKGIKRLKINTYSWLPHFRLALVIDHHLHYHYHHHHHYRLLNFHCHWNYQCYMAIQDEMESRCSKSKIMRQVLYLLGIMLLFSFKKHHYFNKYGFVEKKSMGGEMSFRPLVRPHRSFTLLFSHPSDKL
jgi:hypothetical protein